MKRFLSAVFFTILLLCGNVCDAQTNNQQTDDTPVTISAEKKETPTNTNEEKIEQNTSKEDPITDVSAEDLAIQERMADAAEKANDLVKKQNCIALIGLVLLVATTVFAGGAWKAGSDGVRVTKEMGIAQTRSYVDVLEVYCYGKPRTALDKQAASKSKPAENSGETNLVFEFVVRNSGTIPAEDVVISYKVKAAYIGNKPIKTQAQALKFGYIGPRSESEKVSIYNCEIAPKKAANAEMVINMTIVTYSNDALIVSDPKAKPIVLTQKFFGIYRINKPLSVNDGQYITKKGLENQTDSKESP